MPTFVRGIFASENVDPDSTLQELERLLPTLIHNVVNFTYHAQLKTAKTYLYLYVQEEKEMELKS